MTFSYVSQILLKVNGHNPAVIVRCDVSGDEFLVISVILDGVRKGTVIDRRYFPMDCEAITFNEVGERPFVKLIFLPGVYPGKTDPGFGVHLQNYIYEAIHGRRSTRTGMPLYVGHINGVSMDNRASNISLFTKREKDLQYGRSSSHVPKDLVKLLGSFDLPSSITYDHGRQRFYFSSETGFHVSSSGTNSKKNLEDILVKYLDCYAKSATEMAKRSCDHLRQQLTDVFFEIMAVATETNALLYPPPTHSRLVQSDNKEYTQRLLSNLRSI